MSMRIANSNEFSVHHHFDSYMFTFILLLLWQFFFRSQNKLSKCLDYSWFIDECFFFFAEWWKNLWNSKFAKINRILNSIQWFDSIWRLKEMNKKKFHMVDCFCCCCCCFHTQNSSWMDRNSFFVLLILNIFFLFPWSYDDVNKCLIWFSKFPYFHHW